MLKLARADEDAASRLVGQDQYYYIEYLDWIGSGPFEKEAVAGPIRCWSCAKVIGNWSWQPSDRYEVYSVCLYIMWVIKMKSGSSFARARLYMLYLLHLMVYRGFAITSLPIVLRLISCVCGLRRQLLNGLLEAPLFRMASSSVREVK